MSSKGKSQHGGDWEDVPAPANTGVSDQFWAYSWEMDDRPKRGSPEKNQSRTDAPAEMKSLCEITTLEYGNAFIPPPPDLIDTINDSYKEPHPAFYSIPDRPPRDNDSATLKSYYEGVFHALTEQMRTLVRRHMKLSVRNPDVAKLLDGSWRDEYNSSYHYMPGFEGLPLQDFDMNKMKMKNEQVRRLLLLIAREVDKLETAESKKDFDEAEVVAIRKWRCADQDMIDLDH